MALVQFKTGTSTAFKALETKDSNTLYFLNDTFQLYKGNSLYSKSYKVVETLPETGVEGVLYVVTSAKTLYEYDGTKFNVAFSNQVDNTVTQTGKNAVSGKAVYNYVLNAISNLAGGDGTLVTDVTYDSENHGKLIVSKGTDNDTTVTLTGLVSDPTYNEESKVLSLPVVGGTALTINLGALAAGFSSGYYDAETKKIILVLENGTNIEIDAAALIDVYNGTPTSSKDVVRISVDNTTNIITASLIIDENTFKVTEDGKLTVDLSNTSEGSIGEKISTLENSVTTLETAVGQIDTKVSTAKSEAIAGAKDYTDNKIAEVNSRIDDEVNELTLSLTWQTIS